VKTSLDLPAVPHEDSVATCDLITALEANPRFRRDSVLGGIFHPGKISYRDVSPTNSVHVIIDGDRVSAHVDEISPLVVRADGTSKYAWSRVVAHNLLVMIADLARRARGQHRPDRCNLHCQAEWVDDDDAE
jgi:hypothetical protein